MRTSSSGTGGTVLNSKSRIGTPSSCSDGIYFIPPATEPDFIARGSFRAPDMVQMSEMIQLLSNENKALRRKLFLNGINLPEDSRKAMSISPSRFLNSQGSQQYATMFTALSGTSSPMRSRSARTLGPSNPNSRPGTTPKQIERPDKFQKLPEIPDYSEIKRPTTGKTVAFAEDTVKKIYPMKERPRTAPTIRSLENA